MIELLGLGEYAVFIAVVSALEFLGGRFILWLGFVTAEIQRRIDEEADNDDV